MFVPLGHWHVRTWKFSVGNPRIWNMRKVHCTFKNWFCWAKFITNCQNQYRKQLTTFWSLCSSKIQAPDQLRNKCLLMIIWNRWTGNLQWKNYNCMSFHKNNPFYITFFRKVGRAVGPPKVYYSNKKWRCMQIQRII